MKTSSLPSCPPRWYCARNANPSQGLVISEPDGRNIAVTYDPADGPLVAAAPEMLAALCSLRHYCEVSGLAKDAFIAGAMEDAAAAIRKAKNEF